MFAVSITGCIFVSSAMRDQHHYDQFKWKCHVKGSSRRLVPADASVRRSGVVFRWFAVLHLRRHNLKESPVDLQPLTTIQQNNSTPQPPHSRDPITLTVCVTTHPSTTSRQHHFHRTALLYMERRIFFAAWFEAHK